jgi:hypothetical protein
MLSGCAPGPQGLFPARIIPKYKQNPGVFDEKILALLYTTNVIESLNRDLRKAARTRASFTTETAAMKLLYLA